MFNMGSGPIPPSFKPKKKSITHEEWHEKYIYTPETVKASLRREKSGWLDKYCPIRAKGIDIGSGYCKVRPNYYSWDILFGDGDCTLMEGIEDEVFDVVYASHVLEHVIEPHLALKNWFRILKPGGNLLISIPHRDLYEKRKNLPSQWNPDHKYFWLPDEEEPPDTLSLTKVIKEALPEANLHDVCVQDSYYKANGDEHPIGEFSIEAIISKFDKSR